MKKATLYYGILLGLLTVLFLGKISRLITLFNTIQMTQSNSLKSYEYLALIALITAVPLFLISLLFYKKNQSMAVIILAISTVLFVVFSVTEEIMYFKEYINTVNAQIEISNPGALTTDYLLLNKKNETTSFIISLFSYLITLCIAVSAFVTNKKDKSEAEL